jgi:hypothetical protein
MAINDIDFNSILTDLEAHQDDPPKRMKAGSYFDP